MSGINEVAVTPEFVSSSLAGLADKMLCARLSLADARGIAGLTQQELGERMGCHWVTVSRLENGHIELTEQWLRRVAAALYQPGERE